MVRMLFPMLVLLSGCAAYQTAANTNAFLVQEARYTKDATAVGQARQTLGVKAIRQSFKAEANAYTKLVAARTAGYDPASVADLKWANDMLETAMDEEGVLRDADSFVDAP